MTDIAFNKYRQGPPLRRLYFSLCENCVKVEGYSREGQRLNEAIPYSQFASLRTPAKESLALYEFFVGVIMALTLFVIAWFYIDEKTWFFGVFAACAPMYYVWYLKAKANRSYEWEMEDGFDFIVSKDGNSEFLFESFATELDLRIQSCQSGLS